MKVGAKKIVFIIGNSRSGTTMLGRVLGNHSQVHNNNDQLNNQN